MPKRHEARVKPMLFTALIPGPPTSCLSTSRAARRRNSRLRARERDGREGNMSIKGKG